MAQGIDRHMHLTSPFPFTPVISRPGPTLRCGLQGAAVQDRCRRLPGAAFRQPQHHAQVMHHGLKHVGAHPAPRLLIDGFPRRQVIRHHAPWRARPRDPAQAIEDVAQRMVPLRRVLGHEGQIGGDKGPFIVIDITGVGFAFHTASVSSTRSA
jgi:hypothetical protein